MPLLRARVLAAACILAILSSACGPSAGGVAGIFVGLKALNEALKGVHSAIQQADDATKDRLADADSRMARTIRNIDDLLDKHEKKGEQIANDILDKAFTDANDLLYNASEAVQEAGFDYEFKVNNVILNAARVLSAIPFVKVEPFVSMIYPQNLVPGTTDDYHIELLGYFKPEWGDHTFSFPDGTKVKASIGADNRLAMTLPKDLVTRYEGKRITVKFRFPNNQHWLWPNGRIEREIWLHVLPASMLDFKINATAKPDVVYDYPQLVKAENVNADAGEERNRDIPWGFEDLTVGYDFVNIYEKSQSSIESAILKPGDVTGNNPTSDNSASLPESAGQRVVLHLHAHGKPGNMFGNGAGANTSARVTITLKLARKNPAVPWHFQNGEKSSGVLSWGGDKELFPEGSHPLESMILDLVDHSFDPPQQRTLALRESYQSKYVTVTTKPERISLRVRSIARR